MFVLLIHGRWGLNISKGWFTLGNVKYNTELALAPPESNASFEQIFSEMLSKMRTGCIQLQPKKYSLLNLSLDFHALNVTLAILSTSSLKEKSTLTWRTLGRLCKMPCLGSWSVTALFNSFAISVTEASGWSPSPTYITPNPTLKPSVLEEEPYTCLRMLLQSGYDISVWYVLHLEMATAHMWLTLLYGHPDELANWEREGVQGLILFSCHVLPRCHFLLLNAMIPIAIKPATLTTDTV